MTLREAGRCPPSASATRTHVITKKRPTSPTPSRNRSAMTVPRISRLRLVVRSPSRNTRKSSPPRAGSTVLPMSPTAVRHRPHGPVADASEKKDAMPAPAAQDRDADVKHEGQNDGRDLPRRVREPRGFRFDAQETTAARQTPETTSPRSRAAPHRPRSRGVDHLLSAAAAADGENVVERHARCGQTQMPWTVRNRRQFEEGCSRRK